MLAMKQERSSDSSTGVDALPKLFDERNTTAKDRNILHLKGKQEQGIEENNKIQAQGQGPLRERFGNE